MKRKIPFLWLLLLPLLACLEPGPTPLGPEASDLDPPDSLLIYENFMALLAVESWEEPHPLFNPEMLLCGEDRLVSGFKAEPIWSFDFTAMQDFESFLTSAEFIVDLPPTTWTPDGSDEVLDWDNPDIGRNIRMSLMSFEVWPDEETALESLESLAPDEVTGEDPVGIDTSGLPQLVIPVPLETMQAWIQGSADDDSVNLALELPGDEDSGLLRFYALNSLAPQDTVPPPARLKISYFIDEQKNFSVDCAKNAQVLSRNDPIGAGDIGLATGLPRYTHLDLALPDSLRREDLMVLRARLYLHIDTTRVVGVGGHDREAGGLSLRAIASDEAFNSDSPELPEENYLSLASALDLYGSDGRIIDPVAVPLTPWVQDWMAGDRENFGIILALNGLDDRPRSLSFFLDEAGLGPHLEILYARRPDFE